MRTCLINIAVAGAVMWTAHQEGYAQGTFQNLNFEHPVLPLIRDADFRVPVTNGLPGWSVYVQGLPLDRIFYNTVSIGEAAVSLQGPGSAYPPFQGNYFVILQPNRPGHFIFPAIAQTGSVPSWAASLRFYAVIDTLSVSFAGQEISLVSLATTPTYTIYGGDVSRFAGHTGELRFTGGASLDNIQFSPSIIPEPSSVALLGAGALLFAGRALRKRR